MKKIRKSYLQNQLYLPIKINNGQKEYMFDSHNKIKAYKSKATLKMYAPDYDIIAIYSIASLISKE